MGVVYHNRVDTSEIARCCDSLKHCAHNSLWYRLAGSPYLCVLWIYSRQCRCRDGAHTLCVFMCVRLRPPLLRTRYTALKTLTALQIRISPNIDMTTRWYQCSSGRWRWKMEEEQMLHSLDLKLVMRSALGLENAFLPTLWRHLLCSSVANHHL